MKILVINGPNINLLGIREKNIYGTTSYKVLEESIKEEGKRLCLEVDVVQSNIEGEIINYIHEALGKYDALIINPGAYTHYSLAIYDAIKGVSIPTVEVHLTNIYAREEFRRKSVTAPACIGVISGFGIQGYIMAMNAIMNNIK